MFSYAFMVGPKADGSGSLGRAKLSTCNSLEQRTGSVRNEREDQEDLRVFRGCLPDYFIGKGPDKDTKNAGTA